MGIDMSLIRHSKNPFIENMVIPMKDKNVKLSKLGREESVLVNSLTGEVQGTHVTTYKRVDSQQFVKLFTANIALTFDLKAAGIKALNVLLWVVQYSALSKDQVDMDHLVLNEFLELHGLKLSLATLKRGLRELEKAQVIAKTLRRGRYYINPNFCFNGDRIAFTTMIERKVDHGENGVVQKRDV